MINDGPRRALAALFCACLLSPSPALAAAVAELGFRPVAASFGVPAAAPAAPGLLAAPAPGLSAAP
ncbi:MAG TPA: hypothetical protein VH309_03930, partial [Elusimicrobiota bacterium]|nr:hypothetical protein [Elusimicrobiota bacterium]